MNSYDTNTTLGSDASIEACFNAGVPILSMIILPLKGAGKRKQAILRT